MTDPAAVPSEPTTPRDWKAEARGLGYMLRQIEQRYREAKHLGGDSELLASSVTQAAAYVNGPLREALDSDEARVEVGPSPEQIDAAANAVREWTDDVATDDEPRLHQIMRAALVAAYSVRGREETKS